MRHATITTIAAAALLTSACGTGRVRAGQATEIRQEEGYEPEARAEPPEGNIDRMPEAYPLLEVDIERRKTPYGSEPNGAPE